MNRREFFKRLGIFVLALPFVKLFGRAKEQPLVTKVPAELSEDPRYLIEIKLADGRTFFYASKDTKEIICKPDGVVEVTVFDPECEVTNLGLEGKLGHPEVIISLVGLDDTFPHLIGKRPVFKGIMGECYSNYNDLAASAFEVKFKLSDALGAVRSVIRGE